jgi:hypothetical protein
MPLLSVGHDGSNAYRTEPTHMQQAFFGFARAGAAPKRAHAIILNRKSRELLKIALKLERNATHCRAKRTSAFPF